MGDKFDYLTLNEVRALLTAVDSTRDLAILLLFLETGIHIRELLELAATDINWEDRIIHIPDDKRPRDISISGSQVFDALSQWSKERPDTPLPNFFLTAKGNAHALSVRHIQTLIQKYAHEAGLQKTVSYQTLRRTFGVRLFSQKSSAKEAAAILGISDPTSIQRYKQAAKEIQSRLKDAEIPDPELSEPIDTRSHITQLINKAFPIKPNTVRKRSDMTIPITAEPEETIFGRDDILKQIRQCIANRRSVLLTGPYGIGHTHILKHYQHMHTPSIFLGTPIPIREFLIRIANHLDPDWSKKLPTRPTLQAITDFICQNRTRKDKHSPVIIIDQLDRLRATDQDILLQILEHFIVLAAIHDMPDRLKPVWWKFHLIEVPPLDKESSRKLIRYLTQNLTISDYDLLETKLLAMANGFPLAITDMIHTLNAEKIVTTDAVRNLYHDVGTRYRSWASAIIVVWALVVCSRFIALGVHSFEGYILAGIGTSVLLVLRYFVMRLR